MLVEAETVEAGLEFGADGGLEGQHTLIRVGQRQAAGVELELQPFGQGGGAFVAAIALSLLATPRR